MNYQEAKKELLKGKTIRRKGTTECGALTIKNENGQLWIKAFRPIYKKIDISTLDELNVETKYEWEIVE